MAVQFCWPSYISEFLILLYMICLQALHHEVPNLLRESERCLCSWKRLRTFIYITL